MDDILARLGAVLLSYLGKTADVVTELFHAAGRKALELGAGVAGKLEALGAKIAAVPLWLSLPLAFAAVGLVVCYLLRQRLYDRVLVYHLIWVRRRGFSRQRFSVRRGAVRETVEAMARRVELPLRFAAVAVYDVHPDHYLVAFGVAGGSAEDVRQYRRDLRSGLAAMGTDLIAYFQKNVRMLHADAELRALFAVLDGRDPEFAAQRPALGGEAKKRAVPGVAPETARALHLKDARV
ncbi:hypothetical protein DVDV_2780 [Desulfovibrio sp. DV]|uniref:hypothetical protein n=1 Tax=Desulfovibrio sp. DV TaxID=1844708 RepID=UPI00094B978A|nr:hypothetical protein [Desulfovibrio sp. DV]OLN26281.1 hypothetical protein DVDV_2780 [Desulfovibrio sp. DV]